MKTYFSSKWAWIGAAAVTVALVVGGLAFAPAVVHAQGSGPGTPTLAETSADSKDLNPARIYKRLQREVKIQSRNLERADRAGEKVQDLIDKAKEADKDVTSLNKALSAYTSAVEKAKGLNAQAAAALTAHAGFDASGKVTDPTAALKTVEDAGKALKDARVTVKEAGAALRDAGKAWREANPRPTKTPKP